MTHYVSEYGYWAVVVVLLLESSGVPIPGETVLIAAGTYAGATHHLSVWLIWPLGVLGVIIGSTLGFVVGLTGGYRLLRRYGRYIRMNEPELKVGRYVFDRYGGAVVSVGRFVAVLRTYAPFLAGTSRMGAARFALWNLAGAIVWTGTWALLSYYVGSGLSQASTVADYAVGAVAVAAVMVAVLVVRRRAHQLIAVAEAAYPGPLTD